MTKETISNKLSSESKKMAEPVLVEVKYRNNNEGYGAPPDLVCVYRLSNGEMVEVVEDTWDDSFKLRT